MSRIRGKDTTPEKAVRSLLHRMGYRFRLHVRIPLTAKTANEAKSDGRKRTQRAQKNSSSNAAPRLGERGRVVEGRVSAVGKEHTQSARGRSRMLRAVS